MTPAAVGGPCPSRPAKFSMASGRLLNNFSCPGPVHSYNNTTNPIISPAILAPPNTVHAMASVYKSLSATNGHEEKERPDRKNKQRVLILVRPTLHSNLLSYMIYICLPPTELARRDNAPQTSLAGSILHDVNFPGRIIAWFHHANNSPGLTAGRKRSWTQKPNCIN